jgi:hypothetical protein
VFIASYPRSGNTWLRFILYDVLSNSSPEFETINQLIPDVGRQGGVKPLIGAGRLIKTHEPYRREYKRAVYLVRDARDVLISQYVRHRETGATEDNLDRYLETFFLGKVDGYGSWQRHVDSWLDSRLAKNGNLLVLRFEDMRRNPEDTVMQILDFLRLRIERGRVRTAIANNTVEQMRAKEDKASPKILHRASSEEGRFIRSGSVGGWHTRLSEAQVQAILRHAGGTLHRMGYLSTHTSFAVEQAVSLQ